MPAPDVCPQCGAEVPPEAKACPGCGSDETTGWSDQASYDSLDLPDENFSYDDFVKQEFEGEKRSPVPRGVHWVWWLVALTIIALFVLAIVR